MTRSLKIYGICMAWLFLMGCAASRPAFTPEYKYPRRQLEQDYTLFRNLLQTAHPSLYWYITKDSLDRYFDEGYRRIADSMTEPQFKTLLSYVVSKISCGHTTVRSSRQFLRYADTGQMKYFPLSIKFWKDSAVVYDNLNRFDTVLKRGTILTSINSRPVSYYRDSLFKFISADGQALTHKYQTLSNPGGFAAWYKNVFGLSDQTRIGYLTVTGQEDSLTLPSFVSQHDDVHEPQPFPGLNRRQRRQLALYNTRNLQIDTALSTAYCTLNTFSRGDNITGFIRSMFRTLDQYRIQNLVLDVRSNGGGNVGVSNLLTRYITDHRFKLADSLYAISKRNLYSRYVQNHIWNSLSMNVITHRRADGKYHFGYFEHHFFKPKKRHHYNGQVYVITGGNTFSATTLFADVIKGQKNVLLVGEETGGGAYGNTAWMIPDVTLPHTKLRFRLPVFHMVINKNFEKGRGVMPDVYVSPTIESIRSGEDPKLEKVKALILERRKYSVRK